MDNWFPKTDIDPILPNILYLSNMFTATHNPSLLQSLNVSHILMVGSNLQAKHPEMFKYKQVSVEDDPGENIIKYFEECFQFIDEGRGQGKGVLVHCAAGVSRSATIVIAYLMFKNQLNFT